MSTSTAISNNARKTAVDRQDAKGLRAIARHGDADAFTSFFCRYQKVAYSLACHITRQPDLAEEAVQEAMLCVWNGAADFRGYGSARCWLLRIVTNRSYNIIRKRSRQKDHAAEPAVLERTAVASKHEDQTAHGELMLALRKEIRKLGDRDRYVIGLYYAGEMTQEEIAERLSMPPRTVSFRIEKILHFLRTRLVQAGFGLAVIQHIPDDLSNALCTGVNLPAGFAERVLPSVLITPVSIQAAFGKWKSAITLLTIISMTFGMVVLITNAWAPGMDSKTEMSAPVHGPREVSPVPGANVDRLDQYWDFMKGPEPAIGLVWGTWQWAPFKDSGRGVMLARKKDRGAFGSLPVTIPEGPCVVRFRGWYVKKGVRAEFRVMVGTGDVMLPLKVWGRNMKINKRLIKQSVLLFGNKTITITNGKMHDVKVFKRPIAGLKPYFFIENFGLEHISIQELESEEIPIEFKGYESFQREVERNINKPLKNKAVDFVEDYPPFPF